MFTLLRVEVFSGVLRLGRAAVAVLVNMQAVSPSQKPGYVGHDLELAIRLPKTDDSFDRAPRCGLQLRNCLQD